MPIKGRLRPIKRFKSEHTTVLHYIGFDIGLISRRFFDVFQTHIHIHTYTEDIQVVQKEREKERENEKQ
jgi:hypothetical protein